MIRKVKTGDLEAVVDIYNQAVEARFQTGFTERINPADRVDWLNGHTGNDYPMFVYETGDVVVGWLSISPYRGGRAALSGTVEISYFIHTAYQGRGIGSALLAKGIDVCRQLKYQVALAIIIDRNISSIMLAKKMGFDQWGYLPGVVNFDGEICGHVYYGIAIDPKK